MNPRNRGGGPGQPQPGTAATKISAAAKPQDPGHSDTAVRVPARFYGPAGRRTLGVLLVSCPFGCGGVHLHRGAGGLRRAGCGRGTYVLVPVPAVERKTKGAAA